MSRSLLLEAVHSRSRYETVDGKSVCENCFLRRQREKERVRRADRLAFMVKIRGDHTHTHTVPRPISVEEEEGETGNDRQDQQKRRSRRRRVVLEKSHSGS